MLDNLTNRLARVMKTLKGEARLTESNIADALREVRMALLEADVALPVIKDFIAAVKEKAVGEEVIGSLSPGQALVGVVHRELTRIMGDAHEGISFNTQPPAIVLMAGLQGAGKTTTVGKLAKFLKENHKKKVLVVSCDVYRPAAIEQLKIGCRAGRGGFLPVSRRREAGGDRAGGGRLGQASLPRCPACRYGGPSCGRRGNDGGNQRLHAALKPIETLFVVDAMLGQDAVNTAKAFNEALPLTGVVLTKLDGDARGGAALSVRHVTGKPIKFAGVGEKLTGLEAFHPERMASRILGMGDVLSLIEEAKKGIDEEKAVAFARKLKSGKGFDLNDFKEQIAQMRNMGGLSALMDKMPAQIAQAAGQLPAGAENKMVGRVEGIINSMTPAERARPELLKASRKRRIALGAGVQVQEVNRLLNQFEQSQKMMKMMSRGGMGKLMRGMKGMLPGMGR